MRTHHRTWVETVAWRTGFVVVAGASVLLGASTASAQDPLNGVTTTGEICMQRVFGTPVSGSNKLNCTANDISLSKAISVSPATCMEGQKFTLTATFETKVTANARYDAGFFFRIDGQAGTARGDGTTATGQCSLSALYPPDVSPANNLDGDTCGDLNAGTYNVTFTIPDVTCADTDGNGFLNLPNCTSWHSNQGTVCNISDPPLSSQAFDFDPDTKSKCVCNDKFEVPVQVEVPSITVEKTASPLTVPESGKDVTYTVKITNDAQFKSVTVTSIKDDIYGDVGVPNQDVFNNTCPLKIGQVIPPGGYITCSFEAFVDGDTGDKVTDIVEVCGDSSGGGPSVCDDDDATVTITDEEVAPTLDKTVTALANCQVDATYQVIVHNNSAIDTLTIDALTDDKFGDITSAHAAGGGFEQVVSTTCGGAKGAMIAKSGNFPCSFVGRIFNASCSAAPHTNKVTGAVTDDDGVQSTPSDTATVTMGVTQQ